MQTLVLNQGYEPVRICHWTEAVSLWWSAKAEIVEEYEDEVCSTYLVIKIPAVIRLLKMFRRQKKAVKFSRVNVYGRDKYACQYCGERRPMGELTYDHVLPRSQGGKTTWNNIVTCCVDCNSRKAGRTPEQARMRLLKKPVQPTDTPAVVIQVSRESAPAAWRDYLYWTGSLDQD